MKYKSFFEGVSVRNTLKLFSIFLLSQIQSFAQPSIIWEKKYSFLSGKTIVESIDTSETHIYLYTQDRSSSYINKSTFLKTNLINGDTVWTKRFNFSFTGIEFAPIKYANHSVFIGGSEHKRYIGTDTMLFQVVNLDTNSNVKFHRSFRAIPPWHQIISTSIYTNSINDFYFFGQTASLIPINEGYGRKFMVNNLDSLGNLKWRKIYFAPNIITVDAPANMFKYNATNFMLYGHGGNLTPKYPYIVKIRPNGDTIKTKNYNETFREYHPERGIGLYAKNNSVYVSGMVGNAAQPNTQRSFLIKTDTNLVKLWEITLGTMGCGSSRIFELKNDTILFCTWQSLANKIWLYKILPNGTIADSTALTANVSSFLEMRGAVLRGDGSLLLAGAADNVAYVVKIATSSKPQPTQYTTGVESFLPPSPTIRGVQTIPCNSLPGTYFYENNAIDYRAKYTWEVPNATILSTQDQGRTGASLQWNGSGIHTITVTATNHTTLEKSIGMYTVTVCSNTCVGVGCLPQGIEDNVKIKNVRQFVITPNPASDYISVSYALSKSLKNAKIVIYNAVSMQTITEYELPAYSSEGLVSFALPSMSIGLYMCSLEVEGHRINTKKLAIIK